MNEWVTNMNCIINISIIWNNAMIYVKIGRLVIVITERKQRLPILTLMSIWGNIYQPYGTPGAIFSIPISSLLMNYEL